MVTARRADALPKSGSTRPRTAPRRRPAGLEAVAVRVTHDPVDAMVSTDRLVVIDDERTAAP